MLYKHPMRIAAAGSGTQSSEKGLVESKESGPLVDRSARLWKTARWSCHSIRDAGHASSRCRTIIDRSCWISYLVASSSGPSSTRGADGSKGEIGMGLRACVSWTLLRAGRDVRQRQKHPEHISSILRVVVHPH